MQVNEVNERSEFTKAGKKVTKSSRRLVGDFGGMWGSVEEVSEEFLPLEYILMAVESPVLSPFFK